MLSEGVVELVAQLTLRPRRLAALVPLLEDRPGVILVQDSLDHAASHAHCEVVAALAADGGPHLADVSSRTSDSALSVAVGQDAEAAVARGGTGWRPGLWCEGEDGIEPGGWQGSEVALTWSESTAPAVTATALVVRWREHAETTLATDVESRAQPAGAVAWHDHAGWDSEEALLAGAGPSEPRDGRRKAAEALLQDVQRGIPCLHNLATRAELAGAVVHIEDDRLRDAARHL